MKVQPRKRGPRSVAPFGGWALRVVGVPGVSLALHSGLYSVAPPVLALALPWLEVSLGRNFARWLWRRNDDAEAVLTNCEFDGAVPDQLAIHFHRHGAFADDA
ncbi:hypothetical protein BH20VER2_BH20VER2_12400 [soil metagenome]